MKKVTHNNAYIQQLKNENKHLKQKLKSAEQQAKACRTFFKKFIKHASNVYEKKEKQIEELKKEINLLSVQIFALQQHLYTEILEQKMNKH